MRVGWAVRPLEEVAHACLGKMLDKNKNRGESKPYLRNLNVRWFDFDLGDMLQMRFEGDERERYTAKKGDLLICEGGYPGRAAIWPYDEPVYFQKAIHRVRFHEPERAKWFLYYLHLCDIDGSLRDHFTGSGIQHLTGEALKRFHVPLPPLPEQQRIVAILDEAFSALAIATANAEKNLKNSRELFESCLNSGFVENGEGWSKRTIRDVCDLISGQHIDAKDYNTEGKGLAYLTGPSDFGVVHPVISKWTEVPKRTAKKYDILVTVKGSGVGSINLLDADEVAISRQLMAVRAKGANRDFLYFFLSLQQRHFQSLANGAAIPGISREDVLNLSIAIPDRAAQDQLVSEIKALEGHVVELEEHYRTRLSDISELKQSILQKAFSGELTSPPSQAIREAAE